MNGLRVNKQMIPWPKSRKNSLCVWCERVLTILQRRLVILVFLPWPDDQLWNGSAVQTTVDGTLPSLYLRNSNTQREHQRPMMRGEHTENLIWRKTTPGECWWVWSTKQTRELEKELTVEFQRLRLQLRLLRICGPVLYEANAWRWRWRIKDLILTYETRKKLKQKREEVRSCVPQLCTPKVFPRSHRLLLSCMEHGHESSCSSAAISLEENTFPTLGSVEYDFCLFEGTRHRGFLFPAALQPGHPYQPAHPYQLQHP